MCTSLAERMLETLLQVAFVLKAWCLEPGASAGDESTIPISCTGIDRRASGNGSLP